MSKETSLQRLSRWLNIACLLLMMFLPLGSVLIWLQWESWGHALAGRVGLGGLDATQIPRTLSTLQTTLGITVSAVPVGIMVYGLARLRRLFKAFAVGAIFTTENARAIRIFAWCVAAIQIVKFFINGIESMIITMNNAPGQKALVLQLNSDHVMWLFVGLVFVVIAHALEEGHRLADDSASII
jgi:hypothetical protein